MILPETFNRFGWFLPVTVVILAGGAGKRIGKKKLYLSVGGKSLIDETLVRVSSVFPEVLLSCSPEDFEIIKRREIPSRYFELIHEILPDSRSCAGPLEGLLQGLKRASHDWIFLVGSDMPSLMENVIRHIWASREPASDVVVPLLDGYMEPLHAFYSRTCLGPVEHAVESGQRKVTSVFKDLHVTLVEEDLLHPIPGYRESFRNINTCDQLLAWWREGRAVREL